MGVNAGAFLGILLCGYLGEKIGWSYGFGLAGVFMLLGMLQFYFAQKIFGEVGKKPLMETEESKAAALDFEGDRLNPFTLFDKVIIVLVTIIGLVWIINDPASKIGGSTLLELGGVDYSNQTILVGLVLFLVLLISRILRYPAIIRDRMIAIVFFAIFTVCFWASFEQAGGSMTIFAKDYTNRIMSGNYATLFLISNILITVVPIAIITWVLYLLFKQTYKKYLLSNVILGFSFLLIWALVAWMINRDMNSNAFVIDYLAIEKPILDNQGLPVLDKTTKEPMFTYEVITESTQIQQSDKVVNQQVTIIEPIEMTVGEEVSIVDVDKRGNFIFLNKEKAAILRNSFKSNEKSTIVKATVNKIKENEIEIPATWFLILNSLFIIIFAPLFSKWWESKYNPSGATKYGLGLVLLGIGFSALAFGSMGIDQGAKVASVSIIWLVLAYLFHTLGELCLSPVALSYISKLVPGRMIAMMFGIWYIAIAIGNKIAGSMGGKIDAITEQYDMTTFFLIFTFVPVGLGLVSILLNPLLKKLMHGVR